MKQKQTNKELLHGIIEAFNTNINKQLSIIEKKAALNTIEILKETNQELLSSSKECLRAKMFMALFNLIRSSHLGHSKYNLSDLKSLKAKSNGKVTIEETMERNY